MEGSEISTLGTLVDPREALSTRSIFSFPCSFWVKVAKIIGSCHYIRGWRHPSPLGNLGSDTVVCHYLKNMCAREQESS